MAVTRKPTQPRGTFPNWRTLERIEQGQGVDIKRIKFPTPTRLVVPQENLRSPFGPVLITGTQLLGDCVIGPQAWGANSLAVFTPFDIGTDIVTLAGIIITVVVSAGTPHMDVGIYDSDGVRMVSSGSEVVATGHHSFTIAETQLQEGNYYLGVSCDSTVPKVYLDPGYPNFVMAGAKQMASAFPLPATATLVDLATGGGMVCGALEFI